ncbi:hypothetical protein [Roseiterribacter gracilis]|uniref:Uncharacterized protein n=1 Tax=Roseiterribacter gracilis TaxID=2812848 RepID=A0A8S8X8H3_9PROT|nr:hypothetical protein TMPK1_04890 [Rhodospirillales bacterium TMPK1]
MTGRNDTATVVAIGVVAACAATVTHEAIGHGGARPATVSRHGDRAIKLAYVAGTAAAIFAACFYSADRTGALRDAALEIGGASLGLLFVRTGMSREIPRNWAWIGSATIVLLVFTATLGRGLR